MYLSTCISICSIKLMKMILNHKAALFLKRMTTYPRIWTNHVRAGRTSPWIWTKHVPAGRTSPWIWTNHVPAGRTRPRIWTNHVRAGRTSPRIWTNPVRAGRTERWIWINPVRAGRTEPWIDGRRPKRSRTRRKKNYSRYGCWFQDKSARVNLKLKI